MKKVILGMVVIGTSIVSGIVSEQANAGTVWGQLTRSFNGSGFERIEDFNKYESMQYDQSTQWSHAKSRIIPANMYKANILKKHYYDWDNIPTVRVGSQFYHLTGNDMQQVLRDFDASYKYTNTGVGYIRILDDVTKEEVGIYANRELYLQ